MQRLFEGFLRDTPDIFHTLHAAITAGDAEAVRQAAHKCKGSCANFGAQRLGRYATTSNVWGGSTPQWCGGVFTADRGRMAAGEDSHVDRAGYRGVNSRGSWLGRK